MTYSRKTNVFAAVSILTVLFGMDTVLVGQIKLRNALDFDGDGKADVTILRSSENNWYVNKSNGNLYSLTNFGTQHTDTPAPGDYDGDGKGDIAVWRYSNGTFYSLDSSTGALRVR